MNNRTTNQLILVLTLLSCLLLPIHFISAANTPTSCLHNCYSPPADQPITQTTKLTNNGAPRPHIIFITVDSLRPDHLSTNGYFRPTSLNLEANITLPGANFTQATSTAAWTYPANAGVITGRAPHNLNTDWTDPASTIPPSEQTLAEYLHDEGYYTAGFVSAYYVSPQLGFDQGFDQYQRLTPPEDDNSVRVTQLNETVSTWLDTEWSTTISGTQPLFLNLYYYDPHSWYTPPAPYNIMYDDSYTGTLTGETYAHGLPVITGQITPTVRDLSYLHALYDGEITYWDDNMAPMFAQLDSLGLLQDSIIVLTSDHGQMFGEHDLWVHRNSAYEEVLRVPLMFRYTGTISPNLTITTPVQTTDILPTILDLLEIPKPDNLDGQSLLPLLQGTPFPDRSIYVKQGADALSSPDYYAPDQAIYAITQDNWKYIHHFGRPNLDELYYLAPVSPYETDNLITTDAHTAQTLRQQLMTYFNLNNNYLPALQKP
ncbi:MAG TPA: sulfatase [Anaerolineae bacterium]|nr:sulfatase [Anaerolineae bacterium]